MTYDTKLITKYLTTYAEAGIQALNTSSPDEFQSLLVIPVYDEPLDQLMNFLNYVCRQSLALVFIFNAPEHPEGDEQKNADYVAALERTRSVLANLKQQFGAQDKAGYFKANVNENLRLYLLDRCQEGQLIPRKQGVGLARKLGMDFGLSLIHEQYKKTGQVVDWIHSCDADVILPQGYFDMPAASADTSVALYPFEHCPEAGYEQAMCLYDYSLRYYVDQLSEAGSPYAFHTIGSLIVVRPRAYAAVRGIPKRSGAEDFYFLNKLAKVGRVLNLEHPTLLIAGRPSQRVPFGTGPAICKIQNMGNAALEYTFYNPKCFHALKQLLSIISEAGQTFASAALLFERIRDRMTAEESSAVIDALIAMKVEKQFSHLAQKKGHASFERAFHTWFDAFVTLRFIHLLRDSIYPNVCFEDINNK